MFKNALLFQIDQWQQPTLEQFEQRLDGARFVACGATQPESAGWVPPRGDKHGILAENVAGQIILKLRTETKAVPSSVVKTELEAQLDTIEQQTGRRLKGKKAREIKDEIVQSLLPRAFPKRSGTLVWLDVVSQRVLVDAPSLKRADAVLTRLAELLGGGLKMSPLQTALSPTTAMAAWLADKEAPTGFTLDRDCELKQPDSEKATVRYARHTLEIDEVGEHIKQGKLPTQLGLTWAGRVSFVLSEAGAMRKIKLLDGVLESRAPNAGSDDDGFDADVAIATGELQRLIPDLVAALGGPLVRAPGPGADTVSAGAAPWDAVPA
ncbi:MAG: recombination-associated protein RdgC [Rubrivivax sp.]|nr:recombination-associated protein RdgC [Rubrivivax sp.]